MCNYLSANPRQYVGIRKQLKDWIAQGISPCYDGEPSTRDFRHLPSTKMQGAIDFTGSILRHVSIVRIAKLGVQ